MIKLKLPEMPARKRSEARQKIEQFLSEIEAAQKKGFSSDQIAKSLEEHGLKISGATLRSICIALKPSRSSIDDA